MRVIIGDYDRTEAELTEQIFEIGDIVLHQDWTSIYDPDGNLLRKIQKTDIYRVHSTGNQWGYSIAQA